MPPPSAADSCSEWLDFVCSHVAERDSLCLAVQEAVGLLTPDTCRVALAHKAHTEAQLALRNKQCTVLADKLCADLPTMTRYCKMIQSAAARYTADHCVTMLSHYPQTLADMTKQATASRLPKEKAAKLYEGEPPELGPKGGAIQVVEFLDYESPYSPKTAVIMRKLADKYASELHFVIRQFPLPDNPHAHLAAQAALAANAQGKYWAMHDKLLDNRTQLDRAAMLRYAKEIGLDVPRFAAALDQKRFASAVDADVALGKELEVVGMPTLFVNGERILNSVDEARIEAAIEEYLALSKAQP